MENDQYHFRWSSFIFFATTFARYSPTAIFSSIIEQYRAIGIFLCHVKFNSESSYLLLEESSYSSCIIATFRKENKQCMKEKNEIKFGKKYIFVSKLSWKGHG